MKINLEILEAAYVYDPVTIEELNTKELVPKMITRRRLTRAAKIAIYLANQVDFTQGRVIYGSSFGELSATANILDSIRDKTAISPTHFQNSVYNTAISYLSMLTKNEDEIMTISSGDSTSLNVLKAGAIKALEQDTLLLMVTETLNIPNIEEVNHCNAFMESGIALKVRYTEETATLNMEQLSSDVNLPKSVELMYKIATNMRKNQTNIIEVSL